MSGSRMLLVLGMALIVAGCGTRNDEEHGAAPPLHAHEHKLMLSADRFEDLDDGFEAC